MNEINESFRRTVRQVLAVGKTDRFKSKIGKFKTKIVQKFISKDDRGPKISYSQAGEDLLIDFIFRTIGVEKPSYVDIGAHDPLFLSNTALFYQRGSNGINIEPDPQLIDNFKRLRPRDINLNIGISDEAGQLEFYFMENPTINTFSRSEAEKYVERGHPIKEIKAITVQTIDNIIEEYWDGRYPDFMTLDVEGLDMVILQSINFEKACPTVICVETVTPSERTYIKLHEAKKLLESKGYMIYADTFINTIFLKKDRWEKLY